MDPIRKSRLREWVYVELSEVLMTVAALLVLPVLPLVFVLNRGAEWCEERALRLHRQARKGRALERRTRRWPWLW